MSPDQHARTMLPIPDRPSFGLTTYDAKDPDTAYPPIEPLVPPEGAPNVLIILLRDCRAGRAAFAVHPRDRRSADDLGGRRITRTNHRERRPAVAHRGHQHAVQLQRG